MRNPFHSICPYFAMFPESFVQNQLLAYSRPGDRILDPFCGRGTAILESLLNDRHAIGADINPVAACVAGAKADIPIMEEVICKIEELRSDFLSSDVLTPPDHDFFSHCFHEDTLQEILFLKSNLEWKTDRLSRFIAAISLGVLHGESHKTELCLSNRMPRTISTKPDYSIRWWKARNLSPPRRDTFDVLRKMTEYRYLGRIPEKKGLVGYGDSRFVSTMFQSYRDSVSLIITSPPYLDTTDYAEDQWLRLWFLGGPARPTARLHKDDRHTNVERYWDFLREVWSSCADLLQSEAKLVVRIGGTMLNKAEFLDGLLTSIKKGISGRTILSLHEGETSTIRRSQTNSFRPGTSIDKVEHDFAFAVYV